MTRYNSRALAASLLNNDKMILLVVKQKQKPIDYKE